MRGSYWNGVVLGTVICVAIVGIIVRGRGSSGELTSSALIFDVPLVSASVPWILPGASKEFTVQLKNVTRHDVWINELRFSCACTNGTVAGAERLPVHIPAGEAVPVNVMVSSKNGENGPVELKFGVVGRIGDQPIEAGAIAGIRFVQYLNAEPSFLSLGVIKQVDGNRTEAVDLWFPADSALPSRHVTVESDDPCVSAIFEQMPVPQSSLDSGNRRMTFARVTITIDPKIAPKRMKVHVLVRSGANELRIPVLGFVERHSDQENAL